MDILWLNRDELTDPVRGFLVRWGRFTALCYRTTPDYRDLLAQPAEQSAPVFRKIALGCLKTGHFSGCRHLHFEFNAIGVSRSATHQLVRHERFAPVNQQSSRYVDMTGADYVVPELVFQDPEAAARYQAYIDQARKAYEDLRRNLEARGLTGEQVNETARMVLPQALMTAINLAPTFESLVNMTHKRMCKRAEWEIRKIVSAMAQAVGEGIPELAKHFGPPCKFGNCKESKPCAG
ncbi:MAG: FAD-dependent thymidylate synthase [Kiritimatiellia bacterium]